MRLKSIANPGEDKNQLTDGGGWGYVYIYIHICLKHTNECTYITLSSLSLYEPLLFKRLAILHDALNVLIMRLKVKERMENR